MADRRRRIRGAVAGHAAERIHAAIERGVPIVYQPIANLHSGRIVGFESLARFEGEPPRAPDEWFREAASVGVGEELELAALRAALANLAGLPEGAYLSVNVSPETAASPELARVLTGLPLGRIVLELTEHARVEDYDALARALADLRRAGLRIAIDDVGAGFSSLSHVLRLKPDVLKLDRDLVRGINADVDRSALVASLVEFARSIGSSLVAEGVETAAEAAVLRALGVPCAQGYHLGRPSPPPMPRAPRRRTPLTIARTVRYRLRRRAGGRRHRSFLLRPAAGVLLVVLFGGPGMFAMVANAQPGSALWSAKQKMESVRLFLETDPSGDVALHLEFANERLEELSTLVASGADARLIRAVTANLRAHAQAAQDGVRALGAKPEAAALHSRAQAVIAFQVEILRGQVAGSCGARAGINEIVCAALRSARDHAARVLSAVGGPPATPGQPDAARGAGEKRAPAGSADDAGAEAGRPGEGKGKPAAKPPVVPKVVPTLPLPRPGHVAP